MRSSATATSSAIRSRCRARAAGSLVRRVPSSRRPSRCSSARVSVGSRDRRSSCGVVTGCSRSFSGDGGPESHRGARVPLPAVAQRRRAAITLDAHAQLIACTAQRVVPCTCSSRAVGRRHASGPLPTSAPPSAHRADSADTLPVRPARPAAPRDARAKAQRPASGPEARERAAHVLLFPLARLGPLRQGALAELVHADPSTVSRHVTAAGRPRAGPPGRRRVRTAGPAGSSSPRPARPRSSRCARSATPARAGHRRLGTRRARLLHPPAAPLRATTSPTPPRPGRCPDGRRTTTREGPMTQTTDRASGPRRTRAPRPPPRTPPGRSPTARS